MCVLWKIIASSCECRTGGLLCIPNCQLNDIHILRICLKSRSDPLSQMLVDLHFIISRLIHRLLQKNKLFSSPLCSWRTLLVGALPVFSYLSAGQPACVRRDVLRYVMRMWRRAKRIAAPAASFAGCPDLHCMHCARTDGHGCWWCRPTETDR